MTEPRSGEQLHRQALAEFHALYKQTCSCTLEIRQDRGLRCAHLHCEAPIVRRRPEVTS